jgi:hypothetical protein
MKIRMKADVSGSRDGKAWPRRGAIVDLPETEAVQMCRNGMAEPVAEPDADVETATPPAGEQRSLTTDTASGVVAGPAAKATPAPAAKKAAAAPAKKTAARKPTGK